MFRVCRSYQEAVMVQENSSNAMQGIGASLKSWRAMGGLTADELAQSVGVSNLTDRKSVV